MKITKTKKWFFSIAGALIITIVVRYLLHFGDDVIDITEQVNISSNAIAILVGIFSALVFFHIFKHLEQKQEKKDKKEVE
jgi:membrane protein DedA with SNARE-associated domain